MKDDKLIKDESCIGQSTNMPLSNKKPQWEERFNKLVSNYFLPNSSVKWDDIIQFISDLRKHDEEELIKMLPAVHELGQEESLDKTDREYFKEGYNQAMEEIKQLIQDYYNN